MSQADPKNLSQPSPERKPWPMWPIALSIILFIAAYTWIQLEYRKEEAAFEPFQAMKDRQKAAVDKNMYDWFALTSQPVAAPEFESAAITRRSIPVELEKSLPEQLVYYITSRPIMLPRLDEVQAEQSFAAGSPYHIALSLPKGSAADPRFKLLAFYKEGELHLLATLLVDKIEDAADLLSQPAERVAFAIPTDPFEAASVSVKLYSEGVARDWTAAAR